MFEWWKKNKPKQQSVHALVLSFLCQRNKTCLVFFLVAQFKLLELAQSNGPKSLKKKMKTPNYLANSLVKLFSIDEELPYSPFCWKCSKFSHARNEFANFLPSLWNMNYSGITCIKCSESFYVSQRLNAWIIFNHKESK